MQKPNIPPNEAERLAELQELLILDSEPEERFDSVTAFCSSAFKVPIALVSLVDEDRQWFKACFGLQCKETPRDVSFCAHAINEEKPFIVPDTLRDPRFADNPLVTGAPYIRFYAGVPLFLKSGNSMGTLCIIDSKPKRLDEFEVTLLQDLGRVVVRELEKNKSSK